MWLKFKLKERAARRDNHHHLLMEQQQQDCYSDITSAVDLIDLASSEEEAEKEAAAEQLAMVTGTGLDSGDGGGGGQKIFFANSRAGAGLLEETRVEMGEQVSAHVEPPPIQQEGLDCFRVCKNFKKNIFRIFFLIKNHRFFDSRA
jgi:hypothetical protein